MVGPAVLVVFGAQRRAGGRRRPPGGRLASPGRRAHGRDPGGPARGVSGRRRRERRRGRPRGGAEALARAERDLGGLDLVVNATTSVPRDHSFGGGPIAEAGPDRLERWMAGYIPAAWAIMRGGGAALARRGSGTLIQVSGGSARRGMPGRGPWAAAQFAARALAQSLAQEPRPVGVHVALLVADGIIRTERNPMAGRPAGDAMNIGDVAAAVAYLASQRPTAWTHELVTTSAGDTWVP